MDNRGFNLIEVIIVVIIIGVLASLAIPQFRAAKERALDKEAIANLKLIQAGEKIFIKENASYYPSAGSANTAQINVNLLLNFPESDLNWAYVADSAGQVTATRNGAGGRVWTLSIAVEEPTCSGTYCP